MSAMFQALANPNYRVWAGGALVSGIWKGLLGILDSDEFP